MVCDEIEMRENECKHHANVLGLRIIAIIIIIIIIIIILTS